MATATKTKNHCQQNDPKIQSKLRLATKVFEQYGREIRTIIHSHVKAPQPCLETSEYSPLNIRNEHNSACRTRSDTSRAFRRMSVPNATS